MTNLLRIVPFILCLFYSTECFSQSEHKSVQPKSSQDKASWDILFNFKIKGFKEAGVETDGKYIYTSCWAKNMFYKYTFSGNILDSFSIPGYIGRIRDLAYDGKYFYGGANSDLIYKMDFTSHTLIDSIRCPSLTSVRNIAYDDKSGGFWVGGWDDDLQCISPSGKVLGIIPVESHGLKGMFGSAYDKWTTGGPYLWVFTQVSSSNGGVFHQISLSEMLPTGVTHDCSTDVAANLTNAPAGGAFCSFYNGNIVLGGLLQTGIIFGYKISSEGMHCDISPLQLTAPKSTNNLTSSDTIEVLVANNDSLPHANIPVSYTVDNNSPVKDTIYNTIPGNSNILFRFKQPFNFSAPGHLYQIRVYSNYSCDTEKNNDTLITTVTNRQDISAISIDIPPLIVPGNIVPKATFMNMGSLPASFNVKMSISDGYTSTKSITNLAGNGKLKVNFANWIPKSGNYTISITALLISDSVTSNNDLTLKVNVHKPIKVYCYVANAGKTTLPKGPAYTYLQTPGNLYSLADQARLDVVGAGTWGENDKWYGFVSSGNTLVTIDTVTGARTSLGDITQLIKGITYDYTTGNLYGIGYDGTNSSLYKINQLDGNTTLIGYSTNGLLMNLACDTLGNLYSSSVSNDTLYSINKNTGLASKIGYIGFHSWYQQDMEFDRYTNTCIMSAWNYTTSQGELRIVDVNTGATTLIGTFAGNAQITGFAIPYHKKVNEVKELSTGNRIRVFPNPCYDYIIIKSEPELWRQKLQMSTRFSLFDITGKFISENILNQNDYNKISTINLREGIYFYRINDMLNNLIGKGILIKE